MRESFEALAEERRRLANAKLEHAVRLDELEAWKVIGAGHAPVTAPAPEPRVQVGHVVRIHHSTELYRVMELDADSVTRLEVPTGEPADLEAVVTAKLVPFLPGRDRWEPADLLHVVPPVAHLRTLPVTRGNWETVAEDPIAVAGPGWRERKGVIRQVCTFRTPWDASSVRVALAPWPLESEAYPVGCLKLGDSIVVDGRLWRAVRAEGGPELVLEPEGWYGFSQLQS